MSILATIGAICSTVLTVCTAVHAVCRVAESVVSLGRSLGVIKTEESQEKLGERCLAAESVGITPENFDNDYEAYMKQVNEMDMSEVDTDRWTTQEKALKAIEVASGAMVNDLGPKAEQAILAMVNHPESDFYTPERMQKMIRADQAGMINMEDDLVYMDGKAVDSVADTRDDLVYLEKQMNPSLSDEEAMDIIDYYRDI